MHRKPWDYGASQTREWKKGRKGRAVTRYELAVELTESPDDPLRRRAESVAVVSWRLVCSCMILGCG